MKVTNGRARQYVLNRQSFMGNNLEGLCINENLYVVYSYGYYPIHIYKNGQWYENITKYSVTTSKHSTQTRPYEHNIIDKTLEEMKILIGL